MNEIDKGRRDVGGHLLRIVYRMEGTYIKVLYYFLNLRQFLPEKHEKEKTCVLIQF